MNKDEGCKHPSKTDSSKNAGIAKVLEIKIEQPVIDNAQEDKHQATHDNFPVNGPSRASFLTLFCQREREGDACDEKEQREDGVVMPQPMPLNVIHLLSKCLCKRTREPLSKRHKQGRATHDEQHIKATKGIDGEQSFVFHLLLIQYTIYYLFYRS